MYTSANMGLKIWNLTTDLFDYTQHESNLAALDVHNHTIGEGVQIPTGGIANGAVTTAKIASNTITGSDINTSTSVTVAAATIGVLSAGVETATYATAGNINCGTGTIHVVGNNTLRAFQSNSITHGCVDVNGAPVIPTSIVLTPILNITTTKLVTDLVGSINFGIDATNVVPTTTHFRAYAAFSNAPGNTVDVTITLNWIALS